MNNYVIFIVNEDMSKTLFQSYDADQYTLDQINTIITGLDQSKIYSLELHTETWQSVIF